MKLTKRELIALLQNDTHPENTPIDIYLECTNNDAGIVADFAQETLGYNPRTKTLTLYGDYEEDEY